MPYQLSSDTKMLDFEWHWGAILCKNLFSLTRFFHLTFGENYVKSNEDTPILSATKMLAKDSSFWRYKVYEDIC